MLYDLPITALDAAHFETKSANSDTAEASTTTPQGQTARRYRKRRTPSDRLREAVILLAEGRGELLTHAEKPWSSVTFAGTRHEITLEFEGADAVAAGEDFIQNLPEHEFHIPGQLVADATITEVDQQFGAEERLEIQATLLLLEDV